MRGRFPVDTMQTNLSPLPRSVPSDAIAQAVLDLTDAAQAAQLELHSLMVVQNGDVLAEGWWKPYGPSIPHVLYSLSKSFTSTAAGFAIAEGKFSLDDNVVSFFPNDLPNEISPNLAAMRVRDLLAMATGHVQEPVLWAAPPGGNWVKQFLAAPVEKEPGTHFLYNSPATYMVSAIVEQTTGEHLLDYLTPRLFEPLGITGATWETDDRGIAVGGWGLNLPTEAVAKFGQLYLQKGVWDNRPILPEGWVETATRKHVSNGDNPESDWNQGYGFQFWRCRNNAFRGDGAFGQFCVVMPEQNAVVAMTSGVGNGRLGEVLNLVWTHLLPALKSNTTEPATPSETVQQKCTERLAGLEIAHPAPGTSDTLSLAAALSHAVYRFDENDQNIASVEIALQGGACALTFTETDGKTHRVLGGLNEWKAGDTTFLQSAMWPRRKPTPTVKTQMRGAWTNANTLAFKLCFFETPFSPTLTFRFEGDAAQTLTLTVKGNVGFGPMERPPLHGKRA